MKLAAPEHQEMNIQIEVTWRTLRTIAHSIIVHARVSEAYIHFSFMYTIDNIFTVLPIKDMINEGGDPTTTYKLLPRHINSQQVQNLQYLIYACYFSMFCTES